jgi:hypothetical protein
MSHAPSSGSYGREGGALRASIKGFPSRKATVALAKGGRSSKIGCRKTRFINPRFASQGIDKNLAKQAWTLGALSEERFEQAVAKGGGEGTPTRARWDGAWETLRESFHK